MSDTSPCSSDGANIESGNARHNGITELTSAPATPDLPIVGQCSDDPIVEPLPRPPFPSMGNRSMTHPLHQDGRPCRNTASSSSRRVLRQMNSETAVDLGMNDSMDFSFDDPVVTNVAAPASSSSNTQLVLSVLS